MIWLTISKLIIGIIIEIFLTVILNFHFQPKHFNLLLLIHPFILRRLHLITNGMIHKGLFLNNLKHTLIKALPKLPNPIQHILIPNTDQIHIVYHFGHFMQKATK